MSNLDHAAAQARPRKSPLHVCRCPRCGLNIKPQRSHGHRLRNFLLLIYRDRNGHPGLADDAVGRTFLMILLSLGLSDDEVYELASWITLKELLAIKQSADRFKPTAADIGRLIGFTNAEYKKYRKKYRFTSIRPHNVDWDAVLRKREQDRNKRGNARRRKAKAALFAACRDENEVAIIKAMMRIARRPGCWHDCSVKNIINTARAMGSTASRHALRHALDRLDGRGLMQKWWPLGRPKTTAGRRKKTDIYARAYMKSKTSKKQDVNPIWPVTLVQEEGAAAQQTPSASPVADRQKDRRQEGSLTETTDNRSKHDEHLEATHQADDGEASAAATDEGHAKDRQQCRAV